MNRTQLLQGTLDLLVLRILLTRETETWQEFALSMRRILREGR